MGRYVSRPLTVQCKTLEEVRQFLRGCRGATDQELFGQEDYWQPPEEFEERKAGDCEDFSLWTWRQMLAIGLDARVVFGRHGRHRIGHAWVMFFRRANAFWSSPNSAVSGFDSRASQRCAMSRSFPSPGTVTHSGTLSTRIMPISMQVGGSRCLSSPNGPSSGVGTGSELRFACLIQKQGNCGEDCAGTHYRLRN